MKSVIFDFNGTLYDFRKQNLYPETIPVIQALREKGHRLFIVSTAFNEEYKDALLPYTEKIQNLYPKSKENLERFMAENEIDLSRAVIVGDYRDGEIQIGIDLGVFTIWFDEDCDILGPKKLDNAPLWKINNLKQILEVI